MQLGPGLPVFRVSEEDEGCRGGPRSPSDPPERVLAVQLELGGLLGGCFRHCLGWCRLRVLEYCHC